MTKGAIFKKKQLKYRDCVQTHEQFGQLKDTNRSDYESGKQMGKINTCL